MAKAAPWEPPPDPDFAELAADGYCKWLADQPEEIAFDTETTGLAYFDTPFCVTAAWYRPDGSVTGHYFELEKFDASDVVRQMLARPTRLIGHNIKFDIQKTKLVGLYGEPWHIHDTQILAHLVNEHRNLGLKDLMVSELGWSDTVEVPYSGKRGEAGETRMVVREKHLIAEARRKLKLKKEDGYDLLPRGIVAPYAITDATGTMQLYRHLRPLVERYPDNWSCYTDEMELTDVLLDMEDAGLGVISDYVATAVREYTNKVLRADIAIGDIVKMPVGKGEDDFNPASNPQLIAKFAELGIETANVDKAALKKIDHPLARALMGRRSDEKMLTTYLRPIQAEQRDDVLHPSFRQNVSTGRMSSGANKED